MLARSVRIYYFGLIYLSGFVFFFENLLHPRLEEPSDDGLLFEESLGVLVTFQLFQVFFLEVTVGLVQGFELGVEIFIHYCFTSL